MCSKDKMPKTDNVCRGTSCNEIKVIDQNTFDTGNRYHDGIKNLLENEESDHHQVNRNFDYNVGL